ncbi:hypothetical protein N9242_03730 [Vicingaceae bacterium]|nr:hypothetical protein [Vicingaceae bacterium]
MAFKTEQETFWAGEFGDAYIERNDGDHWVAANTSLFAQIFCCANSINSIIEFGANIGLNLMAIERLLPEAELSGVEINSRAAAILRDNVLSAKVYEQSILDFKTTQPRDLAFTKGVLIHIEPESLNQVYETLYRSSRRYILVCEYYNPAPVEIEYRGHPGKLFKRDFAGEMLDMFDLRLVDYGFVYHRDKVFPQDDMNWFLLEKYAGTDPA